MEPFASVGVASGRRRACKWAVRSRAKENPARPASDNEELASRGIGDGEPSRLIVGRVPA